MAKEKPEKQVSEPDVDTAPQEVTKSIKDKVAEFQERTLEELKIDETNLNGEMVDHTPKFFKASARYTKAAQIYDREKQKLEEIVAEKYMELKLGAEKTTEAYLEKASKYCPEARAQKQRVIDAEYQMNYYKSIEVAFIHKRDMLVQLGSTARAENKGHVQINRTDDEDTPRYKNGRPTTI